MSANTTLTIAQAVGSAGHDLHVADAAYNLLGAPASMFAQVTSVTLLGAPTLSIAQFSRLHGLPGFAIDPGARVILADSLTALAAALALAPGWLGQVGTIDTRLDGSHLGAAEAALLADLAARGTRLLFTPFGTCGALPVTADARDLAHHAGSLARLATVTPIAYDVIDRHLPATAREMAALAALPGFEDAGAGIAVADTGTNLSELAERLWAAPHGTILVGGGVLTAPAPCLLDPALHFAPGASAALTGPAALSAAQLVALAALPGFALSEDARITMHDDAAALLALPHWVRDIAASCVLSDADVTIGAEQAGQLASLPGFRSGGAHITVTDNVARVLAHQAALTTLPAGAAVQDNIATLGLESGRLAALGRRLLSVTPTDGGPTSAAAAASLAPFAAIMTGPPIRVADNATNIVAHLAQLDALGGHVLIDMTDTAAWIGDDAAHLATLTSLRTVTLNDRAPMCAQVAAGMAPLAGRFVPDTSIDIQDSRAAIVSHGAAIAALGTIVDNVTFLDTTVIASADAASLVKLESQLTQSLHLQTDLPALVEHRTGVRQLAAACVLAEIDVTSGSAAQAAAQAALLNALDARVTVADTAEAVAASLGGLSALANLRGVTLTDGETPKLCITSAQRARAASVLEKIVSPFRLVLDEAPAPIPTALLSVTLADLAFAAQRVPPGTRLDVRGSAQAIAADVVSDASLLLQGSRLVGTVTLEGDGEVTLAEAAALARAPDLRKDGHSLTVRDEIVRLTSAEAAAVLAGGLVDRVRPREDAGTLVLTAAAAVALLSLPGFEAVCGDGATQRVAIADGAAQIEALHDRVAALPRPCDQIVIDSSATITAASFARLRALGAVAAPGAMIIVRDTAASIAEAALSHARAGSLWPDRWTLSGPAIVSAARAVLLARLAHFTTGPYQLTLSGSAVLTVAEANALGTIAACISTAGHALTLGAAEDRDGLSAGAAALVEQRPAAQRPMEQRPVEQRPVEQKLADERPAADDGPPAHAPFLTTLQAGPHMAATAPLGVPFAALVLAGEALPQVTARLAAVAEDAMQDDALALAPGEFAPVLDRVMPGDDHILSAVLRHTGVADTAAARAARFGATLNVYGESGSLLSSNAEMSAGFTVAAPDAAGGAAFSVTECVDGTESPPVVVLDASTLEEVVSAAHGTFAESGAIQVGQGKFLDLYTAGNVPVLDAPALVYDPGAHTVAIDVPGNTRVPLIILGASTPPALDVAEILVRRHG